MNGRISTQGLEKTGCCFLSSVGLHLQACKPCTCPSLGLKKEPGVRDRDVSGLMDGGSYMSEARCWSDTSLCRADDWQDRAASLAPKGRGRLPVIGGIDGRLAHRLPGKQTEGPAPHCSFDKLSWWRCSDLKIRTTTSWGLGHVGRSVMCVGRRWNSTGQAGDIQRAREHLGWPDHIASNLVSAFLCGFIFPFLVNLTTLILRLHWNLRRNYRLSHLCLHRKSIIIIFIIKCEKNCFIHTTYITLS